MRTFLLSVGVSGDAFSGEDLVPELRRILSAVSATLNNHPGLDGGTIRDVFGNTCGVWGFEPELSRPEVGPWCTCTPENLGDTVAHRPDCPVAGD